jgi:hypothetical protein
MNKEKLLIEINDYCKFVKGWNGYDAEPIPIKVVENAKVVLENLLDNDDIEVFPTARDSIQFEYEDNKKYVEIEIFGNSVKIYYETDEEKEETYTDIIYGTERFNALVLRL